MNLRDSERRGGPEPGQVKLVKVGGAEERKEKAGEAWERGAGRAWASLGGCVPLSGWSTWSWGLGKDSELGVWTVKHESRQTLGPVSLTRSRLEGSSRPSSNVKDSTAEETC